MSVGKLRDKDWNVIVWVVNVGNLDWDVIVRVVGLGVFFFLNLLTGLDY